MKSQKNTVTRMEKSSIKNIVKSLTQQIERGDRYKYMNNRPWHRRRNNAGIENDDHGTTDFAKRTGDKCQKQHHTSETKPQIAPKCVLPPKEVRIICPRDKIH